MSTLSTITPDERREFVSAFYAIRKTDVAVQEKTEVRRLKRLPKTKKKAAPAVKKS